MVRESRDDAGASLADGNDKRGGVAGQRKRARRRGAGIFCGLGRRRRRSNKRYQRSVKQREVGDERRRGGGGQDQSSAALASSASICKNLRWPIPLHPFSSQRVGLPLD